MKSVWDLLTDQEQGKITTNTELIDVVDNLRTKNISQLSISSWVHLRIALGYKSCDDLFMKLVVR